MSHDRGCFRCHEDPISYKNCTVSDCPNRESIPLPRKPIPGVHESFWPGDPLREPAVLMPLTKVEARTCVSCGRTEALWPNCFRSPADCPQRGGRPFVRIVTVTEPGYDVALFFNDDGGAEAVITRPGDKQPIGINIAPPGSGRRIVVERRGSTFEILYRNVP